MGVTYCVIVDISLCYCGRSVSPQCYMYLPFKIAITVVVLPSFRQKGYLNSEMHYYSCSRKEGKNFKHWITLVHWYAFFPLHRNQVFKR